MINNEKSHALVNRDGRDVRDAADAVAWNGKHNAKWKALLSLETSGFTANYPFMIFMSFMVKKFVPLSKDYELLPLILNLDTTAVSFADRSSRSAESFDTACAFLAPSRAADEIPEILAATSLAATVDPATFPAISFEVMDCSPTTQDIL